MTKKIKSKPTVYFDGSCPLCLREIGFFQKRTSDSVNYVDVSASDFVAAEGLEQERAMARFHVRDENGVLHDGAEAFFVLWRRLPGLRVFVYVIRTLKLAGLVEWAYCQFLKLRPYLQKAARRYDRSIARDR